MSYRETRDEGTYASMPIHVRALIRITVWQMNILNFFLAPLGFSPMFTIYVSGELEYEEEDYHMTVEEEEEDLVH